MAKTTTAAATTAGALSGRVLRVSRTILAKSVSAAWSTIGEVDYWATHKFFKGWG